MRTTILTLEIRFEQDVVLTRQQAGQIAELLGFDAQDRARIATAVSEIARNAFQYAGGGLVDFFLEGEFCQVLLIGISDKGRGIANLPTILNGQYTSTTGMGLGIIGTRRLMDRFEIESSPQGTKVLMGKTLPKRSPKLTPQRLSEIKNELLGRAPRSPFEEIQRQNQELLRAMEELRKREDQLIELNRELEDTNRGVVALYAELDEKADFLQRASELKTRFLSNMTHEFRTPLNSIISLSHILLDQMDGALNIEQEKQVTLIQKSAADLSELVNDLLDLAKVEAGKIVVHPNEFEIDDLFATLRGMLRPLLWSNTSINLLFEETLDIPPLSTDEGKVAQILRNFISNALKYTESGEIRVGAVKTGNSVTFSVSDTGIGVAPEDYERIFEDFVQIDSSLQKRVKGTGLGLPLSRKLAELLGGSVWVSSEVGKGSTFFASIPRIYTEATQCSVNIPSNWKLDSNRLPLLVVEDNIETLLTYEKYFQDSNYQLISARTLQQAQQALYVIKPVAIILDILLEEENTWAFLAETKQNQATAHIPIVVVSVVNNEKQAIGQGADGFFMKPAEKTLLLNKINSLIGKKKPQKILIIDDDFASRYILKQLLAPTPLHILEATEGKEGIRLAEREHPAGIVLDLVMPEMSGIEVLNQLKSNPATCLIPVIVNTSKILEPDEKSYLAERAAAILSKETISQSEAIAQLQQALVKVGLTLNPGGDNV